MSFSLSEVRDWVGGRLANEAQLTVDPDRIRVDRPAELAGSRPSDLAYFFSKAYQSELPAAAPGILITAEPFVKPLEQSGLPLWKTTAVVACPDPYSAMAALSIKFAAKTSSAAHLRHRESGEIHPTAIVHPGAEIASRVTIGPHCVIEEGARIGEGTVLYAGCFVGPRVVIGRDCVLFPRVTLYEWTQLGDRVRLHAGVVLGADGFGYAPKREGGRVVGHQKIYHLGRVVIGDDAEIGANTCIDRGTLGDTRIEKNAKIDDLVMIGHNCFIDEGAIICGKAGLSGRAKVGKYACIGGAAGMINDVYVGDGAMVGAHTLIINDVPPGMIVAGNPHREHKEHFRIQALMNRMLAERGKKKNEER